MKRGAPDHHKIHDLADQLEAFLAQKSLGGAAISWQLCCTLACGIMERLWHSVAEYAPDGDIGRINPARVAGWVGWTDDPRWLIEALVTVKLLDRDGDKLLVHDWSEHCEDSVHLKLARAVRTFADGKRPSMARLNREERAHLESKYAEAEAHNPSKTKGKRTRKPARERAHGVHTVCTQETHGVHTACALPSHCLSPASAQPEPLPRPLPSQRPARAAPAPSPEPTPEPAPTPVPSSPPLRLAGQKPPSGDLAGGLAGGPPDPRKALGLFGVRDPAASVLIDAGVTAERIRVVGEEVMRDTTVRSKGAVIAHRLAEELGATLPTTAGKPLAKAIANVAPETLVRSAQLERLRAHRKGGP